MGKCAFSLMLLLIFFIPRIKAQYFENYAVHANIVYHFTKYVNWPEHKKSGDFVIGIVGNSPLYDELKRFIAGKRVGKQKIVLRQFATSSKFYNCHILFISDDASKSLKKIVTATNRDAILLVSEGDGFSGKGSCINFAIVNERLKLEINKTNIEERNLDIASELLSLGVIVE